MVSSACGGVPSGRALRGRQGCGSESRTAGCRLAADPVTTRPRCVTSDRSTPRRSWGRLLCVPGVLLVFSVSSSFCGDHAPDPVFDIGGAVSVAGPDARRLFALVPARQELGPCLADQRGEGAVGIADRLGRLGVVVVGGQGQKASLCSGRSVAQICHTAIRSTTVASAGGRAGVPSRSRTSASRRHGWSGHVRCGPCYWPGRSRVARLCRVRTAPVGCRRW